MKIVQPRVELIEAPSREELYRKIELAARTCYKSEGAICEGSAEKIIRKLLKSGHEAMIEHGSITAKFVCDRGVTHEIVRHRLASFAQESTRYCNYSGDNFGNEITVIEPLFFDHGSLRWEMWYEAMYACEKRYMELLADGASPQEARSVLPNSLKTEIVITMNIREWRHFFKLRAIGITGVPHPQMRQVALIALDMFKENWPVFFEDLEV